MRLSPKPVDSDAVTDSLSTAPTESFSFEIAKRLTALMGDNGIPPYQQAGLLILPGVNTDTGTLTHPGIPPISPHTILKRMASSSMLPCLDAPLRRLGKVTLVGVPLTVFFLELDRKSVV